MKLLLKLWGALNKFPEQEKIWRHTQKERKRNNWSVKRDTRKKEERETYVVHWISFQIFFVQAFKIVIDSWEFNMLLLYILFKLGKNATETYGMLQTAFQSSYMNRASVFEWHKRFKEGRESVRDDERCGRSNEVRTPQLIGLIKNFMNKGCRVSIETISAQFDVRLGTVHTIIHE